MKNKNKLIAIVLLVAASSILSSCGSSPAPTGGQGSIPPLGDTISVEK